MHTLIIDGSPEIAKRLRELISEANKSTSVDTAFSYRDATAILEKARPDVVVIDVDLPQNQSFELLKFLNTADAKPLIIVLSIHNDAYTKNQCLILGADYFFDKYQEFEKIPGLIDSLSN